MTQPIVVAEGVGGTLEVRQGKIRIVRRGMLAALQHGAKGDKEIRIDRIAGVQFKKPGFGNGYIQFSFSGGDESKGGLFDAVKDENTVVFNKKQAAAFVRAKEEIDRQMDTPTPAGGTSDVVSQIERLAKLKEQGALTEEEFDAQKRKLLDS